MPKVTLGVPLTAGFRFLLSVRLYLTGLLQRICLLVVKPEKRISKTGEWPGAPGSPGKGAGQLWARRGPWRVREDGSAMQTAPQGAGCRVEHAPRARTHGRQGRRQEGDGEAGCGPATGPTAPAPGRRGEPRNNGARGRRPSALWPVAAPTRREATAGIRRTGFPRFRKRGSGVRPKAAVRGNLLRVLTPCCSVWPSWRTCWDRSCPRLRPWGSGPTS